MSDEERVTSDEERVTSDDDTTVFTTVADATPNDS
jgi:hypothetical protein